MIAPLAGISVAGLTAVWAGPFGPRTLPDYDEDVTADRLYAEAITSDTPDETIRQ